MYLFVKKTFNLININISYYVEQFYFSLSPFFKIFFKKNWTFLNNVLSTAQLMGMWGNWRYVFFFFLIISKIQSWYIGGKNSQKWISDLPFSSMIFFSLHKKSNGYQMANKCWGRNILLQVGWNGEFFPKFFPKKPDLPYEIVLRLSKFCAEKGHILGTVLN